MAIEDAFNFIRIDDLVSTAGQPTEEQFRDARNSGFEVVINLAPDGLETSLPAQRELLASLGLEYHHLPVAWTEPRLDQLRQFEALMAASSGRKTLIHCQANYRVTAFFASYATAKLGWDYEKADALIERIWLSRPGYQMDETWKAFIAMARHRPGENDLDVAG
jgi:uncharacterized protein (TIGR01244 family)